MEANVLIAFEGKVVDVQKFFARHPGGSVKLIENNRTDITDKFKAVGHSKTARALLEGLTVCTIAEWEELQGEYFFMSNKVNDDTNLDNDLTKKTKKKNEFHTRRRRAMLALHPEIEELYGVSNFPLIYGVLCLLAFIVAATLVDTDLFKFSKVLSSFFLVVIAWILLPFFAFGLNNACHEICHGNTSAPSSSASNYALSHPESLTGYCGAVATKTFMLLSGVIPLNHFLFYYYFTSHISHHTMLGNGQHDRTVAFRSLYFNFFTSVAQKVEEELRWSIDGDLFGLHPDALVDTAEDVIGSLFTKPKDDEKFGRYVIEYL